MHKSTAKQSFYSKMLNTFSELEFDFDFLKVYNDSYATLFRLPTDLPTLTILAQQNSPAYTLYVLRTLENPSNVDRQFLIRVLTVMHSRIIYKNLAVQLCRKYNVDNTNFELVYEDLRIHQALVSFMHNLYSRSMPDANESAPA